MSNRYIEAIIGMVHGASGLGSQAMGEVVDALIEALAVTSVPTVSDAHHDLFIAHVCARLRARGGELRESFLRFDSGEPCGDPACPVHGTRR